MGRGARLFFESPHAVTFLLILGNTAAFALTLTGGSLARIEPETLFRFGALYPGVLAHREYWRLLAYAFLHANVLHFGLNMMCIAAWSGLLEHRLGGTYFLIVYLAAAVGGGLASLYGHAGSYLGVGASGAISGILGGLLCLTILGKLPLSPQFFIVTVGVNGILAARVPSVDWMAHLGGFAAGFAACAVLDGAESLNRYWLRCKFPEPVKFGIAAAAAVLFWGLYPALLSEGLDPSACVALWGAAVLTVIKLVDVVLSQRKGLALATIFAAASYAGLAFLVGHWLEAALSAACDKPSALLHGAAALSIPPRVEAACRDTSVWTAVLAALVFIAALFLLGPELRRGLRDVGFVANGFKAERRRRHGL